MGSSASEEDIIMATLLQAEQAAAAITTNFASFPENINNLVQQTLKPFLFFKADDQYSLQQQQQQQSVFPFPFPFPSTTATATSHLLSSLRDAGESGNHGDCDGDNRKGGLRVRTVKMKRMKGRRKVREPRFCFKTMTDVDVLDDGYKWRKYGQKVVKNTLHPRSYYRCTEENCKVKKRVERLAEDPRMVITTYEGRHAHSPSDRNLEDTNMGCLNTFFC
ncbi:probable WRKY transcription factor 12 [Cucurbita pepo subsp. pepo]|uniref:probable WRKY transcription factor 12 n=1 Tax=Cucurbita pepo subsp. pepo TaxID=3664 RepID=UPI000C9D922E|nr:probable WRKY transcription factor 12 [Cucurbita pepo subsp. pepo]